MKALHKIFLAEFQKWEKLSRKVVAYANDPRRMKFAPKISNGTAQNSFNQMRDQLDKMEGVLEKQVAEKLGEVNQTKAEAVASNAALAAASAA